MAGNPSPTGHEHSTDDPLELRVIDTVAGLNVVAILGGLAVRSAISPLPLLAFAIFLLPAVIIGWVPFWVRRTNNYSAAAWLICGLSLLMLLAAAILVGGMGSPILLLLPVLPLMTTFLLDAKAGRWMMLVLLATIAALTWLPKFGKEFPLVLAGEELRLAQGLMLAIGVLLSFALAAAYEKANRESRHQLRHREELYRRIFEQSKDVIALTTLDGQLIDVNRSGLQLYGFESKEQAREVDINQLYSDPQKRQGMLAQLTSHGFTGPHTSQHRTAAGDDRYIQGTTSLIRDAEGQPKLILAIMRDVTDQRRSELERERLLDELASKNTELERFAYSVAHDLKSPLFTFRGVLDLLRGDLEHGSPRQIEDDLQSLEQATDRMNEMIEGLLRFSSLGYHPDAWVEVSLGDIVQQAVEMVGGFSSEKGATFNIASDLPTVRGEPALLLTIVQNLIENAVKFSQSSAAPKIDIGHQDGVIFVRDNGIGIPADSQDHIFGLFRKLDSKSPGTGIGLASVQRAVEIHGGKIWVESDGAGQGTTFRFTLSPRDEDRWHGDQQHGDLQHGDRRHGDRRRGDRRRGDRRRGDRRHEDRRHGDSSGEA